MARTRLLPAQALILGVLSAAATWITPVSAQAFCQTVAASLASCPTVATVPTDITKYIGRWYGVGVSAQFAFAQMGQQGGQCVTANYSRVNSFNGRNIKVVNNALGITGQTRTTQSRTISSNAGTASNGLRSFCISLVSTSINNPKSVATSLATITSQMGSAPLSAAAKTAIADAAATIQAAIASASSASQQVSTALEAIQAANMVLSGGTLPTAISTSAQVTAIQTSTAAISAAGTQQATARTQILAAARVISATAGTAAPMIKAAADAIVTRANTGGSLNSATNSITGASSTIATTAGRVLPEAQSSRLISITGSARQSAPNSGAITVTFFGITPSAPNYNIIRLEGAAASGYSTAVVYSCSPSTANGPQIDLFILSRTPTISASTLTSALAFVQSQGIYLAAGNTFVTVSEDSGLCSSIFSRP